MSALQSATARSRRRTHLVWTLSVVILVGAITLVWVLGGFERASDPYRGDPTEAGSTIETTFWDVSVESAALYPGDKVVVRLVATNTRQESAGTLTHGMIYIKSPSGDPLLADYCLAFQSTFSPLIPTPAECTFLLEGDAADWPASEDLVEVFILEQQMSSGLLVLPEPEATDPVARVKLLAEVVT